MELKMVCNWPNLFPMSPGLITLIAFMRAFFFEGGCSTKAGCLGENLVFKAET